MTWSFIGEKEAALFGGAPHVLANPISEEMKHMRPSLIPGLAAAARRNLDRGATSMRLFELGRRYLAEAERATSVLLAGEPAAQLAIGQGTAFDAFDAKAEALARSKRRVRRSEPPAVMDAGDTWHPGRWPRSAWAEESSPRSVSFTARARSSMRRGTSRRKSIWTHSRARTSERARSALHAAGAAGGDPRLRVRRARGLAADALIRAIRGADKARSPTRAFRPLDGEQG